VQADVNDQVVRTLHELREQAHAIGTNTRWETERFAVSERMELRTTWWGSDGEVQSVTLHRITWFGSPARITAHAEEAATTIRGLSDGSHRGTFVDVWDPTDLTGHVVARVKREALPLLVETARTVLETYGCGVNWLSGTLVLRGTQPATYAMVASTFALDNYASSLHPPTRVNMQRHP